MDFYERKGYCIEDLNDFIELEVEENRHLDYKDGAALSPDKILEITKDVSSFANSDGGIIIYGVGEDKNTHKPSYYAPIIDSKFSKEWLEQKINLIQPKIKGLTIYPIRLNKKATKSIYIVKIPRSDDAPHMADDKRYYRRGNFSSEIMHSDEVRDCFHRFTAPLLRLMGADLFYEIQPASERKELFFRAFVQNNSRGVASLYKINVYIFTKAPVDNISLARVNGSSKVCSLTKMDSKSIRIGIVSEEPIFKNECIEVGNFFIIIPDKDKETFFSTSLIRVVLLFEKGATEILYVPKDHSCIKEVNAINAALKKDFPDYIADYL